MKIHKEYAKCQGCDGYIRVKNSQKQNKGIEPTIIRAINTLTQ